MIGSCKRKLRQSGEPTKTLIIRRLRCVACSRIHHELPDCIVPYKRFESKCIEEVISSNSKALDIEADEKTLYRVRRWFREQSPYLIGSLKALTHRMGQVLVEEQSELSLPAHQRIGLYVGNTPGWLARTVRAVVNSNLWVHTRFACLSENF